MLRLARVTIGFWPVIVVRSPTAASSALAFAIASPRPMLTMTFSRRGISIGFGVAELAAQGRRDVVVVALAQAAGSVGGALKAPFGAAAVVLRRPPSARRGFGAALPGFGFGVAFVRLGLTSAHLHLLAAVLADAHPAPVLELRVTDAGRLVAARADDLDVADVQRHRQVEDAAGLRRAAARAGACGPC